MWLNWSPFLVSCAGTSQIAIAQLSWNGRRGRTRIRKLLAEDSQGVRANGLMVPTYLKRKPLWRSEKAVVGNLASKHIQYLVLSRYQALHRSKLFKGCRKEGKRFASSLCRAKIGHHPTASDLGRWGEAILSLTVGETTTFLLMLWYSPSFVPFVSQSIRRKAAWWKLWP